MAIYVEGLEDIEGLFLHIRDEGPKRLVRRMIKAGEDIRDLAKQMAPVDEGNLEEAIKLAVSAERDMRGRFAKREISVYIDLEMDAPPDPTKTVGDYAYEVHEHVTPYGPKNLGPKSRIKQAGTSVVVGGGYLERAALEIEEALADALEEALGRL